MAEATWRRVLEAAHDRGLAVSAMPSIDVLSVGGTISANAHGVDFRIGSLVSTIRSLLVMLADGTVRTLDRDHGGDLFRSHRRLPGCSASSSRPSWIWCRTRSTGSNSR